MTTTATPWLTTNGSIFGDNLTTSGPHLVGVVVTLAAAEQNGAGAGRS
jgi:hypothetical protein